MSRVPDGRPLIYTAGKMVWAGDDATWRRSVESESEYAEFVHPTDAWTDHGGDLIEGCVSEDMTLIGLSDGVVGYITERTQVGTTVEVLHAASAGKPTLLLVDRTQSQEVGGPGPRRFEGADGEGGVNMRLEASDWWFLVNYLGGDSTETPTHGGSPSQNNPRRSLRRWPGLPNATVVLSVTEGEVTDQIDRWVRQVFA